MNLQKKNLEKAIKLVKIFFYLSRNLDCCVINTANIQMLTITEESKKKMEEIRREQGVRCYRHIISPR